MRIRRQDLYKIPRDREYWACALFHYNMGKRAKQHLEPTPVLITERCHVLPLNKKGKPIPSRIIRRNIGGLEIYDNQSECIEAYKELCTDTVRKLGVWFDAKKDYYNEQVSRYKKLRDKYK